MDGRVKKYANKIYRDNRYAMLLILVQLTDVLL